MDISRHRGELNRVHLEQKLTAFSQSGPINLSTLRHAPGTLVHALQGPQGHTKAVSALALSSDETSVFSGSWDQSVKVGLRRTKIAEHV